MNPGTLEYHRDFIERIDENIKQLEETRRGHEIKLEEALALEQKGEKDVGLQCASGDE